MRYLFPSCLPSTRHTKSGLLIVMIIAVVYLSSQSFFLLSHQHPRALYWQNPVAIQHIQSSTLRYSKPSHSHETVKESIHKDATLSQIYSLTSVLLKSRNYSQFEQKFLSTPGFNLNPKNGVQFDSTATEKHLSTKAYLLQSNQQNLIFPELNASSLRSIDLTRIGQLNLLYFETSKTVSGYSSVQHHNTLHKPLGNSTEKAIKLQDTPSPVGRDLLMAFQPLINGDERLLMLYVFQQFVHVCDSKNLTYFLYGGALLGAYRHHDIIPWDDDIDVMMAASQRSRAHRLLSSIAGFGLSAPRGRQWKFYWKGSPTLPLKDYRWPYIDIFFFDTNGTHIYDDTRQYRATFRYPLTHVFPLQLRPFAGALLPVPCNVPAVLRVNYFPWLCVMSSYLHKLESSAPRHLEARAACSRLFSQFPFVFRQRVDNSSVLEMVIRDGKVLSQTTLLPFCGQQSQSGELSLGS